LRKLTPILFTAADEAAFECELRASTPDLRIVDDRRWPTTAPPLISSINASSKTCLYLWDPSVTGQLPSLRRPDGLYEGPASGVVVQFRRSRIKDSVLLAGDISAGFTEPNEAVSAFVARVWKALHKVSSTELRSVAPETREPLAESILRFRAGHDALAWARQDCSRYFSASGPFWIVPR
jgi:hypothetical protein